MCHYLDNAATTPVRPEAAQAAMDAMLQGWGNPSSVYALGTRAAAQVQGWRGDTSITQRIKCDLYYIENWSFLFDIKIILMTAFCMFNHSEKLLPQGEEDEAEGGTRP